VPDGHHDPSAALVPVAPVFSNTERLALAGFLAGYSGLTRQAYELDLRQFAGWCQQHQLRLSGARRAGIGCYARDLEARGRARATITWRLCTIAGFCRYAAGEELPGHSPAAHARRPRLDYESHASGLDRNELGALLVAAGHGPPAEHALISLLALNGLRVSEAANASIEALGVERGHRTLVITRKGGKAVTIALAPRTARATGLAIGERSEGPIFGRRWAAAGPARRRADRPPDRPPRRDHQARRTPHAAARIRHSRPGRRGPAPRRARSRLPRRPAHHHEIRPGTDIAGPARHLHRRHLRRRGRPVTSPPPRTVPPGRHRPGGHRDSPGHKRHDPITMCEPTNAREPPFWAA